MFQGRSLFLPKLRAASDEMLHLDLMRFFAAIAVVIYHFRNQLDIGGTSGRDITQFENMSLAVDLFFVISGIVISFAYQTMGSRRDFMQKRFARLAPLHYATLIIYFAIGFAIIRSGAQWGESWKYRPDCLIHNVAFLQSFSLCNAYSFNHVSWSVSAEMLVYLLFIVTPLSFRSKPIIPLLSAVSLLGVLYALGNAGPESRPWHAWTFDVGVGRAVPAFLLGMAAWGYRDLLAKMRFPRIALVTCTATVIAGLIWEWPRGVLIPFVYVLAVLALAADRAGRVAPSVAYIAPLGALTYGIYMLHPLVRTLGLPVLKKLGLGANVAILLCFLAVVPIAYAVHFAFDQPMRRWLSPKRKTSHSFSYADAVGP